MSARGGNPLRVLLVLDDPDDARSVVSLLSAAGAAADVVHVRSAEDALGRLDQGLRVDVVLLDLRLPGLSGIDAVRAARERVEAGVPVVVLTGSEDAGLALPAIAAGAQDALPKGSTDASTLAHAISFAQERQRLAMRLDRERATAVDANLAKTRFLASVSHEIRTPLNAVLGTAELLAETGLSPGQARHVGRLQRAGAHLLLLVDDVLDLSRIEAGQLALEDSPFDLAHLVEDAIDFLGPTAQRKRIDLRTQWTPGLSKTVVGDARRVRQILINLLANAVKFTDAGFVRVVVAPDPAVRTRGALRISVEDTGIGIAPDKIDAISGTLGRGGPTIAGRRGGAGLGLDIVRRLVDLMGGRMSVESALGSGSRFHVGLVLEPFEKPVSGSAPLADVPSVSASPLGELASLRVLVVDDSEESRAIIAAYLGPSDARVDLAVDARSALEKLARDTFDVVLMDLRLPGMDGVAATLALRRAEAERGAPPVPVVALSADVLPETKRAALASGCNEYLAKPIRKSVLLETLRRYAAGKQALPPSASTRSRTATALLPKFIGHRERDVLALHEALEELDFESIATIGHNMRGNGVSYGFPEVSDIGERLEEAATAENTRSVGEQIAHLEACLERIREEAGLPSSALRRPSSKTRVRAAAPSTPDRKARKT